MKYRLSIVFSLLFFSLSALLVQAFNWPVTEPVVASTFGQNKWDTFGSGIEILGEGVEVRPSEDGEVIFYDSGSRYSELPGGLGPFAVIEHTRKIRTLYSGLALSDGISRLKTVTTADVLGTAGSDEEPGSPNLYFSVIDSEFEQFVNPLLLLNSIVDNKAPVIKEIGVENESGYTQVDGKAIIQAGKATILADVYDPCMSDKYYSRMAPFKIHLFLNGEEIFYVNFESLRSEEGDSIVQTETELRHSDFYSDNGFISFGETTLVPGDSRFELLVSDYSGNETGRTFQLTVIE